MTTTQLLVGGDRLGSKHTQHPTCLSLNTQSTLPDRNVFTRFHRVSASPKHSQLSNNFASFPASEHLGPLCFGRKRLIEPLAKLLFRLKHNILIDHTRSDRI